MSQIYHRSLNGVTIRLGKYSDYEFVIYIGCRLYAEIDNIADAYRMYNEINQKTIDYLR